MIEDAVQRHTPAEQENAKERASNKRQRRKRDRERKRKRLACRITAKPIAGESGELY